MTATVTNLPNNFLRKLFICVNKTQVIGSSLCRNLLRMRVCACGISMPLSHPACIQLAAQPLTGR